MRPLPKRSRTGQEATSRCICQASHTRDHVSLSNKSSRLVSLARACDCLMISFTRMGQHRDSRETGPHYPQHSTQHSTERTSAADTGRKKRGAVS